MNVLFALQDQLMSFFFPVVTKWFARTVHLCSTSVLFVDFLSLYMFTNLLYSVFLSFSCFFWEWLALRLFCCSLILFFVFAIWTTHRFVSFFHHRQSKGIGWNLLFNIIYLINRTGSTIWSRTKASIINIILEEESFIMSQQQFKSVDYETTWLLLRWSKKVKERLVTEEAFRSLILKDVPFVNILFEPYFSLSFYFFSLIWNSWILWVLDNSMQCDSSSYLLLSRKCKCYIQFDTKESCKDCYDKINDGTIRIDDHNKFFVRYSELIEKKQNPTKVHLNDDLIERMDCVFHLYKE